MVSLYRCTLTTLLFFTLSAATLFAQNEIERDRSTLRGISETGFTANLEVTGSLEEEVFNVTELEEQAEESLRDYGLTIISDEQVRSSAEIPYVFMHVNTMDTGEGLVPFSINIRFYQPVRLELNRDIQTSASTWETATVGIVSYDQLSVIQESAIDLLKDFIDDHRAVN